MIFPQHILHALAPTKFTADSYRQFISWRLTGSDRPIGLVPSKDDTISHGLVPMTPAGRPINVWMSNNHTSTLLWSHTMIWGLVTFKEEYIVKKSSKTKDPGEYYLPEPSMRPRYQPHAYNDHERRIMMPMPL